MHRSIRMWLLLAVMLLLPALTLTVEAQTDAIVQILTGRIDPDGSNFYMLADLTEGDTLYVYAAGTAGNLDPIIALTSADRPMTTLLEPFTADVRSGIQAGRDPLVVLPETADEYFLAWDDDGGKGYDAAFEYTVPADGDYELLITSTPTRDTFGTYELTVGMNAPDVLTGTAGDTGDTVARLQRQASRVDIAVQEVTGALTEEKQSTFLRLDNVSAGDTFYAFIEATSGNLAPILILTDYSGKPLASGNFSGQQSEASLQYTFESDGTGHRLELSSASATTGEYRLLAGINAPDVLSGTATPGGRPPLLEPIEVGVGIKLQQITDVDQKAENYGVVASLILEWTDPALAYNPETCQCEAKTYTGDSFRQFVTDVDGRWPEFTLFNQQGNRWIQNRVVVLHPDGRAIYFERFSTTMQAPDFDFHRFPFDTQQFYIRVDSLFPEEYYTFSNLETFTEVGDQLGEEEWYIIEADTTVTREVLSTESVVSRYSFGFQARRHLQFYIFRIIVPIVIIIIVSWVTFFLKDYGKRIEVASANLLLFIAFNFTISSDLPRLGYLTFLDTVLISTFVVTAMVVVLNVYFKRLEIDDQSRRADRIDKYMIWVYPLAYVAAIAIATFLFT